MSVVIGYKGKDCCWLACDQQVTIGSVKMNLGTNHNKVFHVVDRPGCIMGSAGFLRGVNLVETNNLYVDELSYAREEIDYFYMVNVFPDLMSTLFTAHKFIAPSEDKTLDLKNDFIFASDRNLFSVGFDGSVVEVEDYFAIGSGMESALGVMASYDMAKELSDEEVIDMLSRAVLAASTHSIGCGGDAMIINTKDDKIYKIQ